MALFTIFARVPGEEVTYQVRGRSPRDALRKLVAQDAFLEWKGFGPASRAGLLEEIGDRDNPCPVVDTTRNVWCLAAMVRKKLAIFTIVKTSEK